MISVFHLSQGRLGQTVMESPFDDLPPEAVWIDLYGPARGEETEVERLLGISIPTRDEMQEIEASSRLYVEEGALVMTMAVLNKPTSDEPDAASITFILVGGKLVTVRYVDPVPFGQFIQKAKRYVAHRQTGETLLLGLLEQIADNIADVLETATSDMEGLSRTIFKSSRKEQQNVTNFKDAINRIGHVGDLASKAKVSLLTLTRLLLFLSAQSDVDHDARNRIKTLMQDANSIDEHALFLSAKVGFMLDATMGLISLEQNNTIKMFSVAAVVFLPPTLVASVYGMNFERFPELRWEWGYPMALALMFLSAAIPLIFFWRKKWL